MRILTPLSVGGILAAGLLVASTAGAARDQSLYLRSPRVAVSATLTADGVKSPDLQLFRSTRAVRGRAFGQVVNLQLEADRVSGLVGSQPTRLTLSPQEGGGLEAVGLLGGGLSRFKLSPEEISGTVGACSYDLRFTDGRYEGWRSCNGRLETPVFLELPASLAEGGDAQVVAVLGLVLNTP